MGFMKGSNCVIDKSSFIEDGVILGNNVIVKENVLIKKNTFIGDNCILGEYQKQYYDDPVSYCNPELIIGEGSIIRSNTIIYSGTQIGQKFNTGHFTVIREKVKIGDKCSVGTYSTIADEVIIGNNSRIHTHVLVTNKSRIGNNVWVFSNVTTSTDLHPPCGKCDDCNGITIDDKSVIGAASVFMPGVHIEKDVVVASGSLVSKDLKSGYLYGGNPAKKVCLLEKIPCSKLIYENAYPWNKRNVYEKEE